jgi:hypothetical protein
MDNFLSKNYGQNFVKKVAMIADQFFVSTNGNEGSDPG